VLAAGVAGVLALTWAPSAFVQAGADADAAAVAAKARQRDQLRGTQTRPFTISAPLSRTRATTPVGGATTSASSVSATTVPASLVGLRWPI
jgi:hypothetical protein